MSAFDYSASAATALRLLSRFGATVTLESAEAPVNEAGDSVGDVTTTGTELTVLSVPASNGTVEGFDNRQRELYVTGKLRFFIGSVETEARVGDLLEWDGVQYRVNGATVIKPDGQTAIVQKFSGVSV